MLDYRRISWWYWMVTACLLSAGMSGHPVAFAFAIGLTVVNLLHFIVRERSVAAFPVQVRAGFLVLLAAAYPEPMRWLYWLPAVGIWAQVLFGYCLMARMLSLLPWNRREQLTFALMKRTFFSAPVRGSILQGLPPLPTQRHA